MVQEARHLMESKQAEVVAFKIQLAEAQKTVSPAYIQSLASMAVHSS